jgi:hypothetical protein
MQGKKATIEEVSTSGECHEFCATISKDGFLGDKTETPGITILNAEVPHYLNTELGQQILAGQLGDNILVKDFGGNITQLPPGTKIRINQQVILKVRGKAAHYDQERFPDFTKAEFEYLKAWGGVTCDVVAGEGERVCDGQEIEILPREELKGAA